jgi:hypothetical protein
MENQMTESAHSADVRSSYVSHGGASEPAEIRALRIPVGTNLADVERWMIYATLKKMWRKQDARSGVTRCESEDVVQPPECIPCTRGRDGRGLAYR